MFWKFSLVTPRSCVNFVPISPPDKTPPLEIDINVVNKVASTPGGHSHVASTSIGMNDTYTQLSHQIESATCIEPRRK
jgi:hypothetical protein